MGVRDLVVFTLQSLALRRRSITPKQRVTDPQQKT